MRKILLNESQIRLLTEEINKNDSIQKLIFSNPSDVSFDVSGVQGKFKLTPVIGGKKIGDDFITLTADEVNIGGGTAYQLHIKIDKGLRRLNIAEKIYTAFIMQGYPVCSNKKYHNNKAVEGLWKKLKNNPLIHIEELETNGNLGVIIAYADKFNDKR